MLAGEYRDRNLDILAAQRLPHSLGLLYEDLTAHSVSSVRATSTR